MMGTISSIPEVRILPPSRYPYRIYYAILSIDVDAVAAEMKAHLKEIEGHI